MSKLKIAICSSVALFLSSTAFAQDNGHNNKHSMPYAGFQSREVASLSADDIKELRRGGGWGLALPAELKGKPGPSHLLDLADELELTAEQVDIFTRMFEEMRAEAIGAGEDLISAEKALSEAFTHDQLPSQTLRTLVDTAANARANLRFIHLSRHLGTTEHLSKAQVHKYMVLRGYQDAH